MSLIFILCPTPIPCLSPQLQGLPLRTYLTDIPATPRLEMPHPTPPAGILLWEALAYPQSVKSLPILCSWPRNRWAAAIECKTVCAVLCCCVNTWSFYSLWFLASTVNYFCIENWRNGMYLLMCWNMYRCKGSLIFFFFFLFLRKGLTMELWLAWNSQ